MENETTIKNPYSNKTPWPCMRGDSKNSGCLNLDEWRKKYNELLKSPILQKSIISYHTGNSIFSTPIIDDQERIFIGSGDHTFYAFDPHNKGELWHQTQSEIIDSAGCISSDGHIFMVGGDGKVRAFHPDGNELWIKNIATNREKKQFTLSTLYWFEANIVVGPEGSLYAANDDFFLYKLTQNGEIIWYFRTGFLIWSAVGFLSDGTVVLAGFDTNLYAIDQITGSCKWKRKLGGSLVASPAISHDNMIFQGGFDGFIYAIEGTTGKVKWKFDTTAHIYASCSISPDNRIYIGSTNGIFYALDCETGRVIWRKYFGEVIRSSASIGPDIEGKCPYLIYLGVGDGKVYAIEPNGAVRWKYNTLLKTLNSDYPNINASIALGWTGLCIASSTGDIFWIPYDYYLRADNEGIQRNDVFQKDKVNTQWHYLTPGGKLELEPIIKTKNILPTSIISLKLLVHTDDGVYPARILPHSIKVEFNPTIEHTTNLQTDNSIVNIVCKDILNPSENYACKISVNYLGKNQEILNYFQELSFKTSAVDARYTMKDMQSSIFTINRMAFPQPAILPSLNQIGFASLSIPFKIILLDEKEKRFIAYAIQRFSGEGAAMQRVSLYAFSGKYNGEYFMMDSLNCLFEITAFNMPIRIFRIAGKLHPSGKVEPNASLLIEQKIGKSLIPLLSKMGHSSPIGMNVIMKYIREFGLKQFIGAAIPFIGALIHQIKMKTWKMRGLVNSEGVLQGVGTFQLDSTKYTHYLNQKDYNIVKFEHNKNNNIIEAEISTQSTQIIREIFVSILLIDRISFTVIPFNYNNAIVSNYTADRINVQLKLKSTGNLNILAGKELSALLLFDFEVINTIKINLE